MNKNDDSIRTDAEKISVSGKIGKLFLAPGDFVCNWLNVKDEESRFLLRMFVNLTVYGKIALLIMLPFL